MYERVFTKYIIMSDNLNKPNNLVFYKFTLHYIIYSYLLIQNSLETATKKLEEQSRSASSRESRKQMVRQWKTRELAYADVTLFFSKPLHCYKYEHL